MGHTRFIHIRLCYKPLEVLISGVPLCLIGTSTSGMNVTQARNHDVLVNLSWSSFAEHAGAQNNRTKVVYGTRKSSLTIDTTGASADAQTGTKPLLRKDHAGSVCLPLKLLRDSAQPSMEPARGEAKGVGTLAVIIHCCRPGPAQCSTGPYQMPAAGNRDV